jgi:HD-like signal output (HDOD) protein
MQQELKNNSPAALCAFPAAFAKVLSVLRNSLSSADDLAEAIRLDGAVTARVLRLANSASIGLPGRVSSVSHAVVLLGRNRLTSLLLGYAAVSALGKLRQNTTFDTRRYWRHALVCARLSEALAKSMRRTTTLDTDESFTAGLLHDIGKLVVASQERADSQTGEDTGEQQSKSESSGLLDIPMHCIIGEELVKRWLLPQSLCEALKLHHSPPQPGSSVFLPTLVHVADCMTHGLGFSIFAQEKVPVLYEHAIDFLGVSLERLKVLAREVLSESEKTEATIDAVM